MIFVNDNNSKKISNCPPHFNFIIIIFLKKNLQILLSEILRFKISKLNKQTTSGNFFDRFENFFFFLSKIKNFFSLFLFFQIEDTRKKLINNFELRRKFTKFRAHLNNISRIFEETSLLVFFFFF